MGVGPVATFVPIPPWSILGLLPQLYLSASTGITLATGVSQWADQSTHARHFSQATSGSQPALNATYMNGQPAVVGDGVDDILTGPTFTGITGAGSAHVFIVFKRDADPPSTGIGGCWQLGSNPAVEDYVPFTDGKIYCGLFSSLRKNAVLAKGAGFFTSPHIFEVISEANNWQIFIDGHLEYTTNTNSVSNGTTSSLLGDPEASSVRMAGGLSEVLVCAPKLGSTDRSLVLAQFGTTYGITILP